MSKEIRKNRVEFIRYLYSLPEPDRRKNTSYQFEDDEDCLCVQGQFSKKFLGKVDDQYWDHPDHYKRSAPIHAKQILSMSSEQWFDMESEYEDRHRKNFKQIANWLQTLPGWPRVL